MEWNIVLSGNVEKGISSLPHPTHCTCISDRSINIWQYLTGICWWHYIVHRNVDVNYMASSILADSFLYIVRQYVRWWSNCLDSRSDPKLDTQIIQNIITSLSIWAQKWSMKISSQKTKWTLFIKKYSLKEYKPEILLFRKKCKYNAITKILGVTAGWKTYLEET